MDKLKDIKEILELTKEEIENNDKNVTAILDLKDLKSLKYLFDLYNKDEDIIINALYILRQDNKEFKKYSDLELKEYLYNFSKCCEVKE